MEEAASEQRRRLAKVQTVARLRCLLQDPSHTGMLQPGHRQPAYATSARSSVMKEKASMVMIRARQLGRHQVASSLVGLGVDPAVLA